MHPTAGTKKSLFNVVKVSQMMRNIAGTVSLATNEGWA
jgi:hypothetical protein